MISFERVTAHRGGREVLRDLSLQVERGETLALVGRSGAGKSTVLKLINRMIDPELGRVVVDDRDTREWDLTALRRSSGYVLQEIGLFPHMDVLRNVGLVPMLSGWPEERVRARGHELLRLVGLDPTEFAGRWPDQLSGGQRQRVGVARALAIDPPILLMDEPFGALDPITRAELQREFHQIKQRVAKTIVLVTHDMREACALADRVGVLEAGQLVACDTPGALRAARIPAVATLFDA